MGKPIEIKIVNRRPKDKPYGDLMMPLLGEGVTQARMQDPGSSVELVPAPEPLAAPSSVPRLDAGPGPPPRPAARFGASAEPLQPCARYDAARWSVPTPGPAPAGPVRRAGPGTRHPRPPPVGAGEPPGTFPSIPGMNMTDVGPDRNDPFPNRSFADIVTSVEEAPTGRFMVGVAASSFQGLFGNVTVYEKNFDIFNIPRSFSDIFNGKAFRGGGQEFRLDIQPGTLINRFQVSLREPVSLRPADRCGRGGLLVQPLSIPTGTSAAAAAGSRWAASSAPSIYADVAVRIEDINFYGYRTPAPADYLAAAGDRPWPRSGRACGSTTATARSWPPRGSTPSSPSSRAGARSPGPSSTPRAGPTSPTGSRPDGTGKRFFTFRGHFGIATQGMPVYERYFAGNFGSLRGFQYRAVSPHAFGVPIGGVMMALGSVEYQFPWTASDTFQQVVFTDFGTVEGDYNFHKLRVSVGTGLRMLIPQMGPMPLGFDLAFPISYADGDRLHYFNFSMSAMY